MPEKGIRKNEKEADDEMWKEATLPSTCLEGLKRPQKLGL
jgi:hypothetical protein